MSHTPVTTVTSHYDVSIHPILAMRSNKGASLADGGSLSSIVLTTAPAKVSRMNAYCAPAAQDRRY